jgi:hypothetical protein
VALHPSSICHPLESQLFQRPYLVYLEKAGSRGWLGSGACLPLPAAGHSQRVTLNLTATLQVHTLTAARPPLLPCPSLAQVRTSRTFIRDCTPASPAAILLFGGQLAVAHDSSYVQVDAWLRIR